MKNWEIFEKNATKYLNQSINLHNINFINQGGSDSFSNDIDVLKDTNYLFSVESKYSPSQSGQIVIDINNERNEIYGTGDNSEKIDQEIIQLINEAAANKQIIFYNLFYDEKGNPIPNNIRNEQLGISRIAISDRIKNAYKSKNVKFFISSSELDSYKAVIPIDEIHSFFDFSFYIRRKRSGTHNLPMKHFEDAIDELKQHSINTGFNILEIQKKVNEKRVYKTTCVLDKQLPRPNLYFGEGKYYLSNHGLKENNYAIKKRAKTNNINIVFNIKYIGEEKNIGLEELTKYIQDNY